MARQMRETFDTVRGRDDRFFDLFQKDEDSVLKVLRSICSDTKRAAVVTLKDTDRTRAMLVRARQSGKRIIATIADLAEDARDCFVGIDNKAAGATAAYLIATALGDRPATVGVVVGDHAYRCHEDREIGFRTALRQISRRAILAAETQGEDNAEKTYNGVLQMLKAHPGIGAIYNVGGGNPGLARALAEMDREQDVLVVAHEITFVSVPLLANGTMNYVLSQNPAELLSTAIGRARGSKQPADTNYLIDFGVYTKYNLPAYGRALHFESVQAV